MRNDAEKPTFASTRCNGTRELCETLAYAALFWFHCVKTGIPGSASMVTNVVGMRLVSSTMDL